MSHLKTTTKTARWAQGPKLDQGRVGDYVVMGDEARKHWQPVSALVGAQDCTPDPQTPAMSVLTYVHI